MSHKFEYTRAYEFKQINKNMTKEEAQAYLIKLGTHNEDGTLHENYGGETKQKEIIMEDISTELFYCENCDEEYVLPRDTILCPICFEEFPELTSCCGAGVWDDTDICVSCKEHSEVTRYI